MLTKSQIRDMDQFTSAPAEPELSTAARTIISLFRRRLWTFLTIAGVLFAAVVLGTLLLRPEYEAAARIKIDPTRNAATGLQAERSPTPLDGTAVDTEVAVIKSRDLASAVVRDMKLYLEPTLIMGMPATADPLNGPGLADRIDQVTDRLSAKLNAARDGTTYIVEISYRSPDPKLAAAIANAVADHYINNSVGVRTGTASQQTRMLQQRLDSLGTQVRGLDAQIAQGRAAAGIVQGGAQGTITDQQVGPLAAQIATAESAAAAARSTLSAAQDQIRSGSMENISGVLNSNVIADLRRQRAEVLRNRDEIQARYGPRHPESVRVVQQLESIDGQIREEAARITQSLRSEATAADARASSLRTALSQLKSEQASNTRASVAVQSLEQEAETKRSAYNQLAASVQQAEQIKGNQMAQASIVEEASPPSKPAFPRKGLLIGAGLILSLLVAGATIGAQELLSPSLRTAGDIEQRLGLTMLAAIPRLTRSDLRQLPDRKLTADILLEKPASFYAESFRSVRSALLMQPGETKVITMVSTLPGEGKTTSALSLARILAMAGERVLLVDGDLRRGSVRDYVQTPAATGLAEVLEQGLPYRHAVAADAVKGLDIITVSKPLFTTSDLFGTDRMQALMDDWRSDYDRIVIDTPPLLGIADARLLAKFGDAVLLVVRWNSTAGSAVASALSMLQMDEAHVAGAVFEMVDRSSEAIGGYYYSRKYGAYYNE